MPSPDRLGEEATTTEVVGIIVDVTDGITAGDGSALRAL
jgi:hypothetical protein